MAEAYLLMARGNVGLATSIAIRGHEGSGHFQTEEEKLAFARGIKETFRAVKAGGYKEVEDGAPDRICAHCHKSPDGCGIFFERGGV